MKFKNKHSLPGIREFWILGFWNLLRSQLTHGSGDCLPVVGNTSGGDFDISKFQNPKFPGPPHLCNFMNTSFLLIGGNLGEREHNLEEARRLIGQSCGTILQSSSLYETAAWGKTDQPSFLNQALQLQTSLKALPLLHQLLEIERKIGRIRKERYGPRLIDIDILLFNNEIRIDAELRLPHPEMQNRRFALAPLAEIAASVIHPVFHKTITQLLNECSDPLPVKKI
jgi:2-amino-4-hydroxy-6-hydroxymethyldihydropteridine diphosphokinase